MLSSGVLALLVGATFSATAAVAHLMCIVVGPKAYRVMGAGERMARAAQAGRLQPTLITFAIAAILLVWAAYALSGAGVTGKLPLTRIALVAISAVYLGRAVAFPLLKPSFPENSQTFWVVSSGICLVMGLLHLYGVVALWPAL
jgi:hypothetical protein